MSAGGQGGLPAIELNGVGKRYRLGERSMVHALNPARRRAARDLWAVRDIDLRIEPGETVGMLGRNGAGKSTLMRMMAGVSEPTEGTVTVRGRVAPLLSVGVGFHQELTGRENVFVNGMLLGLSRDEVTARFDDIVAFAELEDRIDTQVKFYSSGMFMRLGFSVAIHVDPDILLVDEVLAVGDIAFQLKCFDRMRELVAGGTTIVMVSHSMHAIGMLCPRAVLFSEGQMAFDGPSSEAIGHHHRLLAAAGEPDPAGTADQFPTGDVELDAELLCDGEPVASADQDTELRLVARLRFRSAQESPQFVFRVIGEDGQIVYRYRTPIGSRHRTFEAGEEATAEVTFRPAFGGGGTFRVQFAVTDRLGKRTLGRADPSLLLYVPTRFGVVGVADLGASVSVDGTELNHRSLLLQESQSGDRTPDPHAPPGGPQVSSGA